MKKMGVFLPLVLGLSGVVQAADVMGSLQWVRRVELSTPVSGVITSVDVLNGDEVRKGQTLVSLDPRGFRAALQKAEAMVLKSGEARDEAKRELDRATEMYQRTLLSDHELQLAKIAYVAAEADYQVAEAERTQARLDLEYSRVSAPFDGVVLERSAEVGQTVASRLQPVRLVTLAETGRMLARIEVGEAELAQLKRGQELAVRIGTSSYRGVVQRLGMEPVIAAGGIAKYEADVLFKYPLSDRLRAGQAVTVVLP